DSPDRDEGVAPLCQGVGDEVLELAGLVATVGKTRADVIALGPELCTAQMRGQPFEAMHGTRPENERVALEPVERRRHWHSVASRRPNATRTAPVTASIARRIPEHRRRSPARATVTA